MLRHTMRERTSILLPSNYVRFSKKVQRRKLSDIVIELNVIRSKINVAYSWDVTMPRGDVGEGRGKMIPQILSDFIPPFRRIVD